MTPLHPTAILTRPAGRNTNVMNGLARRGWSVVECPALDIREVMPDGGPVPTPEGYDLVIFVSRAAVTGYHSQLVAAGKADNICWPLNTKVASMGPVTASVIRRVFGDALAVLHPAPDDAQDTETWWPRLMALKDPLQRVLIVRGQDGRDWLSQRLNQQGISVELHQAYRRQPAQWSCTLNKHFVALSQQDTLPTWLLTSPHGIDAIYKNLDTLSLLDWFVRSSFVLTHERLKPLLTKILEARSQHLSGALKCVVAGPEDDVILDGFEQISRS